MEPLELIVVVDGDVGGLCQRRSMSMKAAVGGANGANRCH
jgi:hypothetical protein